MTRLLLGSVLLSALLPAQERPAASGAAGPVLWRAPRSVSTQEWACGPGGCDGAPAPPFQFMKEDVSGSEPKITVKDSRGRTWSVKFGNEVIPECFASRYVSAIGYLAEPTYCLTGTVQNLGYLHRAASYFHKDGAFSLARFELRGQPDFVLVSDTSWSWADNPFRGSRELAGLKILMMLLSNWDTKDARDGDESNNAVFRVTAAGRAELVYGVFDWGASLGKWGSFLSRDRSDCSGYFHDTPKFVHRSASGDLHWGYAGKRTSDITSGVTVEDVRWLLPYLQKITPEQLRAGLKASGATERQTACWAQSLEDRVRQLEALTK